MRRIFAVIELQEFSTFDPSKDEDLDELAEDLLMIRHGVAGVSVYGSLADLNAEEDD